MDTIFRKYELYVKPNPVKYTIPENLRSPNYVDKADPTVVGAYSLKITEPIHIDAEISYDSPSETGGSNTTIIKLYNLSPSERNRINKGDTLLLKAGYQSTGALSVVYTGDILKVYTDPDRSAGNVITVIYCSEGKIVGNFSRVNRTFRKGDSYASVFNAMRKEFSKDGIQSGKLSFGIEAQGVLESNVTIVGDLNKAMSEVCQMTNSTWFVSGGKIHIQPKRNDTTRYENVVTIKPENVIGSIEKMDSGDDFNSTDPTKSQDSMAGIKMSVFLNPNISMQHWFEVTFGDNKGTYKPTKIVHTIQWKTGDFMTTVEAMHVTAYSESGNTMYR